MEAYLNTLQEKLASAVELLRARRSTLEKI